MFVLKIMINTFIVFIKILINYINLIKEIKLRKSCVGIHLEPLKS